MKKLSWLLIAVVAVLAMAHYTVAQEEKDKPTEKAAEKAEDKAEDKPADEKKKEEKPAEKNADEKKADKKKADDKKSDDKKQDDKGKDKPADKPKDKPADKPKDKPADKPKDKPADKPKDKPKDDKPKDDKPKDDKPKDDKPKDDKPKDDKPAKKPAEKPAPPNDIEVKHEVVLEGLYNPCGVAIQPGTGDVFVSDSGAGRVIKVVDGKAVDVITGFPMDVYGKGPKYDIGPLGLVFLDKNTLVVGGGGLEDGSELLRFYALPEDGKPIKADKMKLSLGPIEPGEASKKGEGNFYALAATDEAIFVTCNGDDTKGWVSRVVRNGDDFEPLTPFIATKEATNVDAPVGIAINRLGHVVIGQMGEINIPGDSLLTFYSPKDGKMLLNLETGLHDIADLDYSPKGRLYCVDFAWMDPSQGGLHRLDDDGKGGVATKRALTLDKPSALTFNSDGEMFVTVFGSAEEGSDNKPGKLIKVTGDL